MEKTMEQTVQLIEQGLKDIQANKATKAEVLDLIDERVKADAEAAKAAAASVAKITSELDEQKTIAADLQQRIRHLQANRYDALKNSDGTYRGLWATPTEAKLFGLYLMAATTAGNARLAEKHQAACKAIADAGGLPPRFVREDGVKDMTGSALTGGSALISPEYIPTLISNFERYGVFERNVRAFPVGPSGLQPVDLGDTDEMGGIYCPGEGKTITKSDPTIGMISHTLKTLCKLMAYSLELDEDSAIAVGELLGRIIFRSYGKAIDRIGFLGDGTSGFFGMTGLSGKFRAVDETISNIKGLVVGTGSTGFAGLVMGDFAKMPAILPDYADAGDAKWYMHRYFYWTIFVKLALAQGGSTAQEAILGAGQRQKQALAYPVEFVQVMPRTSGNNVQCAYFGDLSAACAMAYRGGLEIAQSSERYFDQGLIAVRARRRIGINAHDVGDTDKAGPIVGLITSAG